VPRFELLLEATAAAAAAAAAAPTRWVAGGRTCTQSNRQQTHAPTSVKGASAADGGRPYSPRRIMVSRKFTPATLGGAGVGHIGREQLAR